MQSSLIPDCASEGSVRFLATSGKDRALCLYRLARGAEGETFEHCLQQKSAHKRIVWDCRFAQHSDLMSTLIALRSWTSDSSKLLTVSRDGFCKVWAVREGPQDVGLECLFSFAPFDGVAVTAVDVHRSTLLNGEHLVAFGSENGDLQVSSLSAEGLSTTVLSRVADEFSHGAAVKRVRWRPTTTTGDELCFGSSGEDNTLRIHKMMTVL